jgi:hypothetical protein
LGIIICENSETEIKFSDIYAVEFVSYGLVHSPKLGLRHAKECFRERLLNTQEVLFQLSFLVCLLIEINCSVMSLSALM